MGQTVDIRLGPPCFWKRGPHMGLIARTSVDVIHRFAQKLAVIDDL